MGTDASHRLWWILGLWVVALGVGGYILFRMRRRQEVLDGLEERIRRRRRDQESRGERARPLARDQVVDRPATERVRDERDLRVAARREHGAERVEPGIELRIEWIRQLGERDTHRARLELGAEPVLPVPGTRAIVAVDEDDHRAQADSDGSPGGVLSPATSPSSTSPTG